MHERKFARELLGHRDRAPVLFSAFERAETHLVGLEVDVARAQRERLRYPVWASVSAKVWMVGRGWARATPRKRARSSPVRYFRPRASTRVKPACAMVRTIHYAYP